MIRVCIAVLLLAIASCVAQSFGTAHPSRGARFQKDVQPVPDDEAREPASVPICLVLNPDPLIVDAAASLASRMFVSSRVSLRWHQPRACPAGEAEPVFLLLVTHTPASDFSKALGVALPLDGRHAWVFYDRVRRSTQDDRQTSALLAHVMAHEIAHVLQGIVRHSDEGILKARWSPTDVSRMADFPLMFTSADAILIRRGVEERHLRLLSKGPAGEVPIPLALPNKTGFLPLR